MSVVFSIAKDEACHIPLGTALFLLLKGEQYLMRYEYQFFTEINNSD